ncbi:zinc finger, CCHC-type containing protein [Tanacetum coccineum]
MGDENPIRTLREYSKPSHEGYRNTIELPVGNNVDPSPHGRILLLVSLFNSFHRGRTAKLRNDILMFQQHHGESLSEAWTRFKDLLQKVPHHGIDRWLQIQIFYDHVSFHHHVSFHLKGKIDCVAGGKLTKECPSPQPQALGTTFEAQELTTSRIPEKVLIREEAEFPITKNVNYISLARGEQERSDKTDERPKRKAAEMDVRLSLASHSYIYPLGIADDVLVEVYKHVYPVDFVILDIKEDEKRPFILGTPFLTTAKAVIKFDKGTITLRSGKSKISFHRIPESPCKIEKGVKNDIEPIAPIMTVNRLVLEWEERIKLHLEKEKKFNQWRSKNFKRKHPALVKVEGGINAEGEVTLYLTRRSLEVLRKFQWMILEGQFNQKAHLLEDKQILSVGVFDEHLEEIHVTWAHLEKKRTRLRTNTKTLEDLCSQSLETASPVLHDAVTTHLVTASQHFMTASARTDSHADLEDSTHDGSIFSSCYLFHTLFSSTTIGDENPIRTLGDYSKPSHEGYRNTIELPVGNNVNIMKNLYLKHGLVSRTYSENSLIMVLTYGFKFKSSTIMSTAPLRRALTTQQDEGWNDAFIPDEVSLNYENPNIEQLLGIMERKVNTLMKDAISFMGKSDSVLRLTTNEMYRPPSEPSRQEEFEHIVMNFIFDQ